MSAKAHPRTCIDVIPGDSAGSRPLRTRWIRRLHFDVTGLPPKPEDYAEPHERAVERLLGSFDPLHLLGLDHTKLTYYHNGLQRRLTDVHGHVLRDLLA